MIKDEFGLRDEEYWSDPWRTRKALQRPLMQKNQEGLLIGAPAGIPLNQRTSFPVALLRIARLTTLGKIPSRPTVIITALEVGTNELRARLALPEAPRRSVASDSGRTQSAADSFSEDETAMVGEGHTIDLASRLRLPAARGEYLVTAILLDRVSNRCRMKLVESAGYDDPAVDEFVREYRASRQKPAPVFPEAGEPLPSYQRQDNSPKIPPEPGMVLNVTRVNVFSPRARCIVTASYRLPLQPQHVIAPKPQTIQSADAPEETARVPISLLLTGSADPAPQILKLTAPSYEPIESAAGQKRAIGYFSFDLCRLAKMLETPQTYFIYAFSGEVMAGPIATAFTRLPDDENSETIQSW